jgi:hypothetical protein
VVGRMGSWGKVDGRGKGGGVRVPDNSIIDRTRHTLGARRAFSVSSVVPTWKRHAVAPGGPPEGHHGRSMVDGEKKRSSTQWPPEGPRRVSAKYESSSAGRLATSRSGCGMGSGGREHDCCRRLPYEKYCAKYQNQYHTTAYHVA